MREAFSAYESEVSLFRSIADLQWDGPRFIDLQRNAPAWLGEEPGFVTDFVREWEKPAAGRSLPVPRFWPALHWESSDPHRGHPLLSQEIDIHSNPTAVLREFLTLNDAEHVLQFALRWGPLHLCAAHPLHQLQWLNGECRPFQRERDTHAGYYDIWEPVEVWLRLARSARAVIGLSEALRNQNNHLQRAMVEFSDAWNSLVWIGVNLRDHWESRLEQMYVARTFIACAINFWQEWAGARPQLKYIMFLDDEYSSDELGFWRVTISGAGLMGVLATELMYAVTGAQAVALCARCGEPHLPKRLTAGRNSYCPSCGKRAADTDSKRRQRAGTARGRSRDITSESSFDSNDDSNAVGRGETL